MTWSAPAPRANAAVTSPGPSCQLSGRLSRSDSCGAPQNKSPARPVTRRVPVIFSPFGETGAGAVAARARANALGQCYRVFVGVRALTCSLFLCLSATSLNGFHKAVPPSPLCLPLLFSHFGLHSRAASECLCVCDVSQLVPVNVVGFFYLFVYFLFLFALWTPLSSAPCAELFQIDSRTTPPPYDSRVKACDEIHF